MAWTNAWVRTIAGSAICACAFHIILQDVMCNLRNTSYTNCSACKLPAGASRHHCCGCCCCGCCPCSAMRAAAGRWL